MTKKPDYQAALDAYNERSYVDEIAVRAIVDAALGGDPVAFAVDALIAEGGEIVPLCVEHDPFVMRGGHSKDCIAAPHLVFPISVEEETTT